jgi:hypothetical protein
MLLIWPIESFKTFLRYTFNAVFENMQFNDGLIPELFKIQEIFHGQISCSFLIAYEAFH